MGRRDGLVRCGFGKRLRCLGVDGGNGVERREEGRGRRSVAAPAAISADLFGFVPPDAGNKPLETIGSEGKSRE